MSPASLQNIRSIFKNHLYFYTLAMKNLKVKLIIQFYLQWYQKYEILRKAFNLKNYKTYTDN